MVTITVTGVPGALNASATANLMTPAEASAIAVDNQTESALWVEQMIWSVGASLNLSYESLGVVPAGQTVQVPYSYQQAYVGFSPNAQDPGAMDFFQAQSVPLDDSWFLTPPEAGPIVPLRVGCVQAILSPQPDPNPPHNVHPVVSISVNGWDPGNAILWIENDSGEQVIFYVAVFSTNTTTPNYSFYPLVNRVSSFTFPSGEGNPTFSKAWFGFAFAGKYTGPEAYFHAHPAGGVHHTGEIPPALEDGGPGDGSGNGGGDNA